MISEAIIDEQNRGAVHDEGRIPPRFVAPIQVTSDRGNRRTQPQRELLHCGISMPFLRGIMNEKRDEIKGYRRTIMLLVRKGYVGLADGRYILPAESGNDYDVVAEDGISGRAFVEEDAGYGFCGRYAHVEGGTFYPDEVYPRDGELFVNGMHKSDPVLRSSSDRNYTFPL